MDATVEKKGRKKQVAEAPASSIRHSERIANQKRTPTDDDTKKQAEPLLQKRRHSSFEPGEDKGATVGKKKQETTLGEGTDLTKPIDVEGETVSKELTKTDVPLKETAPMTVPDQPVPVKEATIPEKEMPIEEEPKVDIKKDETVAPVPEKMVEEKPLEKQIDKPVEEKPVEKDVPEVKQTTTTDTRLERPDELPREDEYIEKPPLTHEKVIAMGDAPIQGEGQVKESLPEKIVEEKQPLLEEKQPEIKEDIKENIREEKNLIKEAEQEAQPAPEPPKESTPELTEEQKKIELGKQPAI